MKEVFGLVIRILNKNIVSFYQSEFFMILSLIYQFDEIQIGTHRISRTSRVYIVKF